ncbi:FBP domain-containing protein [Psychromicrobium sp. YIM B11713]|uniref:FBP domain-containing protein n=1 Tax=Psychromicrobium sp. YIM B11713 TaxID=3145233 RepID=UPI00374EAE95
MQNYTQEQIRRSFINASRSEVKAINFPADFEQTDWENLDYLGWRDAKMPQRGYLIYPTPEGLIGLLLRATEGGSGKLRKVLCDLCRDVRCEAVVYLYVARRTGAAGRNGNTVGTLICADFQCSANVRFELPSRAEHLDWPTIRERQISGLCERIELFISRVRS